MRCHTEYNESKIHKNKSQELNLIKKLSQMTFPDYYKQLPTRKVTAPKADFIRRIAKVCKRSEHTVRMWVAGTQRPDALAQSVIAKEMKMQEHELFPPEDETN